MANSGTDKASKTRFFDGVKAEFKKISWPDKQSLWKQSVAVVCVSVALGLIISVIDAILKYGISFL